MPPRATLGTQFAQPFGPAKSWIFRLALAAALALPLVGANRQSTHAQSGITILEAPPPEYEFGQRITFRLRARGAEPIVNALLYWQSPGGSATVWSHVAFEPGRTFEATAEFDLANYPLPPFAPISYWWVLEDSLGGTLTSEAGVFRYEDNRFTWQRASQGALTVHWYEGDRAFGQAALTVATNALPRINRDIRAPLPEHVDLYIYSQVSDEQAALERVGRPWADGHADPELGVIIVAVAPDLRYEFGLQREIPHEMTHVLIYRAAGENYQDIPIWLNEGLAVMNQGQRDSQFPAMLAAARDAEAFHALQTLCGAFPTDAEAARLAYAQSDSVVRYLRERFGSEGIHQLFLAYGAGLGCDEGLRRGLNLSLAELQADWLREAIYAGSAPADASSLAAWVVLTGSVLLGLVLMLLLVARASRSHPQRMSPGRML